MKRHKKPEWKVKDAEAIWDLKDTGDHMDVIKLFFCSQCIDTIVSAFYGPSPSNWGSKTPPTVVLKWQDGQQIHPGKLTWNPKKWMIGRLFCFSIGVIFRFQPLIFREHRIHVWSIYIYLLKIYSKNQPNVGKYTSPMDPMGCVYMFLFFECLRRWRFQSTLQRFLRIHMSAFVVVSGL